MLGCLTTGFNSAGGEEEADRGQAGPVDALGLGTLAAHASDEEARGSRHRPSLLNAKTEADRGGFRWDRGRRPRGERKEAAKTGGSRRVTEFSGEVARG